jgi:hypothetical protein
MHKFFIYLPIYFCLTCFRLPSSPSSRGTVYKFGSGSSLLGMVSESGPVLFYPGMGADTIHRRLKPLPNLYTVLLEDGLNESPKNVRQK